MTNVRERLLTMQRQKKFVSSKKIHLCLKEPSEIEAKRQQHDKRITQRLKEKQRMEEIEKELEEWKRQVWEEQELRRREKESQQREEHQEVQHA